MTLPRMIVAFLILVGAILSANPGTNFLFSLVGWQPPYIVPPHYYKLAIGVLLIVSAFLIGGHTGVIYVVFALIYLVATGVLNLSISQPSIQISNASGANGMIATIAAVLGPLVAIGQQFMSR